MDLKNMEMEILPELLFFKNLMLILGVGKPTGEMHLVVVVKNGKTLGTKE